MSTPPTQFVLTQEQVVLLKPLLEQMVQKGNENAACSKTAPIQTSEFHATNSKRPATQAGARLTDGTADESEISLDQTTNDHSGFDYSVEDLLQKKGKNEKSTKAQIFLNYIIRESAKTVDIWDKAPHLRDIPIQTLNRFHDAVIGMCPQLAKERLAIRRRLSDTMLNRRGYVKKISAGKKAANPSSKNRVFNPSSKKSDDQPNLPSDHLLKKPHLLSDCLPKKSISNQLPKKSLNHDPAKHDKIQLEPSQSNPVPNTSITPGTSVDVMFKDSMIGKGILIAADKEAMFQTVILKSINHKTAKNINLYMPVDEKVYFSDLKPADQFEWKSDNLFIEGTRTSVASALLNNESELSDEDEYAGMSEYEKEREKRIKQNKQVLDGLMKDIKKPVAKHSRNTQIKKRKTLTKEKVTTTKKPKYWDMVEIDEEKDIDIFKEVNVCGKRTRKPTEKKSVHV